MSNGYGISFDVLFLTKCAGKSVDTPSTVRLYLRVTSSVPAPEHEEIEHVLECKKKKILGKPSQNITATLLTLLMPRTRNPTRGTRKYVS
jgi:hypothetical protein